MAGNRQKPQRLKWSQMYIFGAGANWNIIWSLRSWKCPWRSGALVGFALLFLVLACTLTLWPLRGAVNIFVSFAGDYTAGGKLSLKLKRPCKVRGGWSCRCVLFVKKKSRDDGDACSLHNWLRLQTFAGCSETEIGCAHGRKKGQRFWAVSFVKGKLVNMQNHLAAQRVT